MAYLTNVFQVFCAHQAVSWTFVWPNSAYDIFFLTFQNPSLIKFLRGKRPSALFLKSKAPLGFGPLNTCFDVRVRKFCEIMFFWDLSENFFGNFFKICPNPETPKFLILSIFKVKDPKMSKIRFFKMQISCLLRHITKWRLSKICPNHQNPKSDICSIFKLKSLKTSKMNSSKTQISHFLR